jgi:phosphoribosylanthranilate isomerase
MKQINQGFNTNTILKVHTSLQTLSGGLSAAEVAPDVSEETDLVLDISSVICEASNNN